jgi:two-component system OmpR family sensor kinase
LAIDSSLRKHWLEIAWALFAAANVMIMVRLHDWETVPFHFVWVSLTLLYGVRIWSLRSTWAVLAGVMLATGGALVWVLLHTNGERPDELTEVPLMAAMFVAMVWHARRYQDATVRARAMAESEHRLRERERDFVRDASHALRTPITVARGHAELILRSTPDDQVRADAEVVIDELHRLSRLGERLLILAAADHVGFLHRTPVDPRRLLEETAYRWTPTVERRWELAVNARGTVLADADRLSIALDALLENAIKFTQEHDLVEISGYALDDALVISVADGGIGVDAGLRARIFDRFAKGDALPGGRGGTGLGLAIVQAIAEAHGGAAWMSETPGGGATFHIRLPGFRPAPGPDAIRARGVDEIGATPPS